MKTWDIFCRVVDNYGDIGVCWRLARQLANEYPFHVRLWVDDLSALTRIWPTATVTEKQSIEGVEICHWGVDFDVSITVADVVIEAFACELPNSYIAAMAKCKHAGTPPHWFNLEYLSAESWVEDCHGLLSMHPQTGLKKAFFFPGFTGKTGGLLREKNLRAERDCFTNSSQNVTNWLRSKGIDSPTDGLLISLFAYENLAIPSLLNAWQHNQAPVMCVVPEGRVLTSINNRLQTQLKASDKITLGQLTISVIPFLNQKDYDRLLWACDINFVRGEDSFVRAQWVAKPLIWHIYPQDDDAHIVKLNAFLDQYTQALHPKLAQNLRQLWLEWNQGTDCTVAWNQTYKELQHWRKHSQNWEQYLNSLGDLASNMVHFCQKTL